MRRCREDKGVRGQWATEEVKGELREQEVYLAQAKEGRRGDNVLPSAVSSLDAATFVCSYSHLTVSVIWKLATSLKKALLKVTCTCR